LGLKPILIRNDKKDVYEIVRLACAECKKALHTQDHVVPIDYIQKDYGVIVVCEYPQKLHENLSVVREAKSMT